MKRPSFKRPNWSRTGWTLAGLTLLLRLVAAARLTIGEPIPRLEDDAIDWPAFRDYLSLRLDRVMVGLFVGGALAAAGVLLQALLRNPLASPYILGLSSGAMVGVTLVEYLGFLGLFGATLALGSTHLGALAGALATMAIVYALGQRRGWIDPLGLLLVGVIVNAVNGALVMFFSYLMPAHLRGEVSLWAMGYFNQNVMVEWPPWSLIIVGLVTVGGIALAAWFGRAMDLATLSDDEAQSMGLNLRSLRLALFALAGMLTAGSIVLAGPIGFVGLICPHFVRLLIGPSHRPLLVGAALAGAALVIAADGAVKLADVGQGLMPLGILTSLIGGPVFLWMLHRRLGGGLNA